MDNKLIEDLKLIATYMGYTYYPHTASDVGSKVEPGWKTTVETNSFEKYNNTWNFMNPGKPQRKYLCRNHNGLRYHSDWNWFHQAWSKLYSTVQPEQNKDKFSIDQDDEWDELRLYTCNAIVKSDIETAFRYLVEGIEWYNKQPKL